MNSLTPMARLSGPMGSGGAHLTRRQKAAIIVRLLVNEGTEVPLVELPEDLQATLTQQMGSMRYVDRETLQNVVDEFADQLEEVGVIFPRGLAGALAALDGKISPQTAARLRKEAGVRQSGDPWTRLRELDVEQIIPILENEAIEIAAVVLSKLDVGKAAAVLGKLPGDKARRITYAVSLTGQVTPEAVDRIGISLAGQMDMRPERAFMDVPEERVGAILNFSPANTREDVLEGLDETDKPFADRVRKAIFTFANIPQRLDPRDVSKITRAVDGDVLVVAMGGATAELEAKAVEFILANMSSRMADGLREQIEEKGKIKAKDAEEAMTEVVGAIRELEASGEIMLRSGDDEGEEEE